jgi:hypothetical protein
MKLSTIVIAASCVLAPPVIVPAAAALAVPETAATTAAAAAVTVARYNFDRGLADQSGRGVALQVRSADGGVVRYVPRGSGRAVVLPTRCSSNANRCPRVILEGGDDADLDPGTRAFRYGAHVRATSSQVGAGANIMQKGVAGRGSQWKMQIGRRGHANCVLTGRGQPRAYLARSSAVVTDGRWHQITCRRAGSTLTILVDGATSGSVAVPANVSVSNAKPMRLGGRALNGRSDQFGGSIDEVFATVG